ncbi:hypothetical protein SM124_09990 [Bacillus sp. 31A1R]|uniref:DUF4367 domain-containing protein n=1 Tax=Robertmurraya mangrovi TaxID=3098077 RepID=A0ABU5IY76_9BACI|nr:hypothetical protein [Bacillus sp. 31A1R]MDZ5472077.1 hypothetical protein [Bacillus sp. 31A1R]
MNQFIIKLIIILLIVIIPGCSSLSPNLMFENVLKANEKAQKSFYQEVETQTYYNGELINLKLLKSWEEPYKGKAKYKLIDSEEGTFYTIFSNNLITSYKDGANSATVKELAYSQFQHLLTTKNDVIKDLESLRKTHKLTLVKEVELANKKTYELLATPRDDSQIMGEQRLWISKSNWMVLKRQYTIGKKQVIVRIKNFSSNPNINYQLPNSKNIKFIFEDKTIKKKMITENIKLPVYLIQPDNNFEVIRVNELVQPQLGYQFFYTKNGVDSFQLVIKKENEEQKHDSNTSSDLSLFNIPVVIEPIPNLGISLYWNLEGLDYELLYFDSFATKQELQQLLDHITKYERVERK